MPRISPKHPQHITNTLTKQHQHITSTSLKHVFLSDECDAQVGCWVLFFSFLARTSVMTGWFAQNCLRLGRTSVMASWLAGSFLCFLLRTSVLAGWFAGRLFLCCIRKKWSGVYMYIYLFFAYMRRLDISIYV